MKCTFWHKIPHKLSRLFFPRRLDHGVPHVCFTVCSCACMCVLLFMFAVLYHIPWRRETGCHGSSLNVEWIAVIFRCVRTCVHGRVCERVVQRPDKDNVCSSLCSWSHRLWVAEKEPFQMTFHSSVTKVQSHWITMAACILADIKFISWSTLR